MMRISTGNHLPQIAEETSYLGRHVEEHTAAQLRRKAILAQNGVTRPESCPGPPGRTTRSIANVLSEIQRASAERLAEMRQADFTRDGPEIRAARSAKFAAQRSAECEAVQVALRPQMVASSPYLEQPPPILSPKTTRHRKGGLRTPPFHWQRSQSLPENILDPNSFPSNLYPHPASIDPRLQDPSLSNDGPGELDKIDVQLFGAFTNSLSPIEEDPLAMQAQLGTSVINTTCPTPSRRASTSSTQSKPHLRSPPRRTSTSTSTFKPVSRSPSPLKSALSLVHRPRRNSGHDGGQNRARDAQPRRKSVEEGRVEKRRGPQRSAKDKTSHSKSITLETTTREHMVGEACMIAIEGDEILWSG